MRIKQKLSLGIMMIVAASFGVTALFGAIPVNVRDSILDLLFVLSLIYIVLFVGEFARHKLINLIKRAKREQWVRKAVIKVTKGRI